ncbi:hypothetical protein NE664_13590 [Anaerotignum faecicola]|nr:hypothetical protein [Anaerotignum faecicola]
MQQIFGSRIPSLGYIEKLGIQEGNPFAMCERTGFRHNVFFRQCLADF